MTSGRIAGGRVCTRCVMDQSAPDIRFDEKGVCNYCTDYLVTRERYLVSDPEQRQRRLDALLDRVRRDGRGKRYDCIIGISGGVDSSWALVKAIELGLRPLAVHMDNGWNAELAQNNIANLVRGLGVDLVTHVIDWREYRGLTQQELGKGLGLSKMTISGLETGKRDTSSRNWRRLANALSVDIDDLIPLES